VLKNKISLHIVWGVAKTKRIGPIGHGRLCLSVSLSVPRRIPHFPRYYTDPDVTWGNGRGRRGTLCVLLGGFAIAARVSYFRFSVNICRTRNVSECKLYSLYVWLCFIKYVCNWRVKIEQPLISTVGFMIYHGWTIVKIIIVEESARVRRMPFGLWTRVGMHSGANWQIRLNRPYVLRRYGLRSDYFHFLLIVDMVI